MNKPISLICYSRVSDSRGHEYIIRMEGNSLQSLFDSATIELGGVEVEKHNVPIKVYEAAIDHVLQSCPELVKKEIK